MTQTDSQKTMIINWLTTKAPLTPMDAIRHIGCTKLSTRCGELEREGFPIKRKPVMVKNRFGKMVRVMQYSI